MRKVLLLDTTLREGEQTPGVSFSIDQKLQIACLLDDIGVDMIEVGDPNVSPDAFRFIKRAAALGLRAEIVAHCRALKGDIEKALATGAQRVAIFLGTSPSHLESKFAFSENEAIEAAIGAVESIVSSGVPARFAAEDATRTSRDFLLRICQAAVEAGADRISVPDTVGVLTPDESRSLFRKLSSSLNAGLDTHNHNDLGLALANTLAAIEGGASCAHVTVNGLGERSGIAPLASCAVALKVHYNIDTVATDGLIELGRLVEKFSGVNVPANSPVVGEHAFSHKAGVHTSAVLKDPTTYEAFPPELLNRKRSIVIDKYTGRSAVRARLAKLGVAANEQSLKRIVFTIKGNPLKGSYTDSEILDLARDAGAAGVTGAACDAGAASDAMPLKNPCP